MKKILLAATVAASALFASSAMAEVSYNVAVTSDYVFRGLTQSDESPAVQGGIDYSNGIFYAGAWASTVDFGDSTDAEVDFYLGVKPTAGNFTFDLGAIYYSYIDAPSGSDYNVTELKAGVSHPMGAGSISGTVYHAPDPDYTYVEIGAAYPLTEKLAVSGAIGKYTDGGYTNSHIGLTYALTDVFAIDGRVATQDATDDTRFFVTLKAGF